MWTYIVGPIVSLLPKGWRKALPFSGDIHWAHAVTLSGFAEFVLALAGLLKWYSISMTTWVNRGLEVALNGKAGPGITDQAIGAMAVYVGKSSGDVDSWILQRGRRGATVRSGFFGQLAGDASAVSG